MNKPKVAGIVLVIAGVLLPLIGYEIPSPINTLFLVDESATSTSYLFFPFINWLTLIGGAFVAVGIYMDWRERKKK